MKAEDVGDRGFVVRELPLQQIAPEGRFEPVGQRGRREVARMIQRGHERDYAIGSSASRPLVAILRSLVRRQWTMAEVRVVSARSSCGRGPRIARWGVMRKA